MDGNDILSHMMTIPAIVSAVDLMIRFTHCIDRKVVRKAALLPEGIQTGRNHVHCPKINLMYLNNTHCGVNLLMLFI